MGLIDDLRNADPKRWPNTSKKMVSILLAIAASDGIDVARGFHDAIVSGSHSAAVVARILSRNGHTISPSTIKNWSRDPREWEPEQTAPKRKRR